MKTNKFNLVYESFMRNIVKEDADVSLVDPTKYSFKNEDNMLICTFTLFRDGKKYIVISKYFNKKSKFSVTDNEGNNEQLSEKEFAAKYYQDYDDYKEALESYLNKENDESDQINKFKNDTNIKSFDEVFDNMSKKEGIKDEKEYKIDDVTFVFRTLADDLINNYCECLFQANDESGMLIYYKALIAIKKSNSILIKVVKFDEDGNMIAQITNGMLQTENPELYDKLFKAIRKMSKYFGANQKL